MTPHPTRCWLQPGHERCALRHAALLAEQRAAHYAARARLFRQILATIDSGQRVADVPPGVLDAAKEILGVAPPTTVTWHGGTARR